VIFLFASNLVRACFLLQAPAFFAFFNLKGA
jgi:hypothetical protein